MNDTNNFSIFLTKNPFTNQRKKKSLRYRVIIPGIHCTTNENDEKRTNKLFGIFIEYIYKNRSWRMISKKEKKIWIFFFWFILRSKCTPAVLEFFVYFLLTQRNVDVSVCVCVWQMIAACKRQCSPPHIFCPGLRLKRRNEKKHRNYQLFNFISYKFDRETSISAAIYFLTF